MTKRRLNRFFRHPILEVILTWGIHLVPPDQEILTWGIHLVPPDQEILTWGIHLVPPDQDAVIKLVEHAKSTVVERLVFQSMDAEARLQVHTRLASQLYVEDHTRLASQQHARHNRHTDQDAVIKLAEHAKSTVVGRLVFQGIAEARLQVHTRLASQLYVEDHTRLASQLYVEDHTRLASQQHARHNRHPDRDAVIKLAEHAKGTVVGRLVFQGIAEARLQVHTRLASQLYVEDHTRLASQHATYGSGCCNQACRTCQRYGGGKACVSIAGSQDLQDHLRSRPTTRTTDIRIGML